MPSVQRKILVAYDFSDAADAAVAFAGTEAHETGATVALLYVLPLVVPIDAAACVAYPSPAEIEKLEVQLREAAAKAHVQADCQVVTGIAAGDSVLTTANSRGINQIVVGTRSRGALGRALLGSVADYIVRNAAMPVTTVHALGARDLAASPENRIA